MPRRAGRTARPTGSAYPAASPRCGSPPGPSRRTRCPAAGSARPAAPRAAGAAGSSPGRPARQQVDGLADHRLLERRPGRVPRPVAPPGVQFHAQPDQVPQRVHLDVAVTIGAIAASQASPGRVAVQPGPAVLAAPEAAAWCPAHRARTCVVHSSCSAEPPSSRSRSARRDMRPHLHRLPGPLGQHPAGDEPAIASASASWHRCSCSGSSSLPPRVPKAASRPWPITAAIWVRFACQGRRP